MFLGGISWLGWNFVLVFPLYAFGVFCFQGRFVVGLVWGGFCCFDLRGFWLEVVFRCFRIGLALFSVPGWVSTILTVLGLVLWFDFACGALWRCKMVSVDLVWMGFGWCVFGVLLLVFVLFVCFGFGIGVGLFGLWFSDFASGM